jgi:2-polyprenyl-6-methoxyphenol hydroxylase-like FAD-dependent oxidoreductase
VGDAHVAFDAAELKLPELGYMVENNVLQLALWQALAAHERITLRVGASLQAMQRGDTTLRLSDGAIAARWLSAPTAPTRRCARWPESAFTPGSISNPVC